MQATNSYFQRVESVQLRWLFSLRTNEGALMETDPHADGVVGGFEDEASSRNSL